MEGSLLLTALEQYGQRLMGDPEALLAYPEELNALQRLQDFVQNTAACFQNDHPPGHVTGSALVISHDRTKVLLTHHRKLGKWLQLGGHSDGHPATWEVAMREAQEESGLRDLVFASLDPKGATPMKTTEKGEPYVLPFDLDIHEIPARGESPGHLHYDVRYLLIATNPEEHLAISHESNDLRWFPWPEAQELTAERSMTRQFSKVRRWLEFGASLPTVETCS